MWRNRTVPSSKKQCRGRKRVNHCHFRGVISTAGIPFLADHTCVQLHLRPPRKHRDRFTAVISLCRCSHSLPVGRRFFPESHGDRSFSTRELERFRRNRRGLLAEETERSLPESKARVENTQRVGELVSRRIDVFVSRIRSFGWRERATKRAAEPRCSNFSRGSTLFFFVLLEKLATAAIRLSGSSSTDSAAVNVASKCQAPIVRSPRISDLRILGKSIYREIAPIDESSLSNKIR